MKKTPMASLVDPREKAEKGLSSLSTPADRFAYWLSQFTSPFVVGLSVFGYIALSTRSHRDSGWRVAHGYRSGSARAFWVDLVGSKIGEVDRSARQSPLRASDSAPGWLDGSRGDAGRAALAFRIASAGGHADGGHRLVRVGHPDYERGEIQNQPTHRLGSRRGDGLLPVGEPDVSGTGSPGGADCLGTLATGGAHPTSGRLWGSPCSHCNDHHVLALWPSLRLGI
jgi:hypothetical protein